MALDLLPDNIKPKHYALSLRNLDFREWKYTGTVIIDSEIVRETRDIVLNGVDIEIKSIQIDIPSQPLFIDRIVDIQDDKCGRVTIQLEKSLPVSQGTIAIEFSGIITRSMSGFYSSRYKSATKPHPNTPTDENWYYMCSTQFESCDARRAFPCFDEPNLKATFDFDIEIPEGLVALSNMPVKKIETLRSGWQVWSFETTPLMSTYLLAWAFGDFQYIETFSKKTTIRIYTTRDLASKSEWALQNAVKVLELFAETFKIEYPLPKLDLLAVHEFSHGAMENWGLITYRITDLLYDQASDITSKQSVAFLNEGFATWAGWYALDKIYPDWKVWPQFITDGVENAFHLDGIQASHPIYVPVNDGPEVDLIFDHISYFKGCCVIRMLADHIGYEDFLLGVSDYLLSHQYDNTRTADLWSAISKRSKQNVDEMMNEWIFKVGYPMLDVQEAENGQISITQSRFLLTGDVSKDDTTVWWIPIGFQSDDGSITHIQLRKEEDTFEIPYDKFYVANPNSTGFYRVRYSESRFENLGDHLQLLTLESKIALITSTADLSFAGSTPISRLLSLLQKFKTQEMDALLWQQVFVTANSIKSIFGDDEEISTLLDVFVVGLFQHQLNDELWNFPPDESYSESLKRKILINGAVLFGHAKTKEVAIQKFQDWTADPIRYPINPSLREAVWNAGLENSPSKAIEILKSEWSKTASVDGKSLCLRVLSRVRDKTLLENDILPFLFGKEPPESVVPAADMQYLGEGLGDNLYGRRLQWEYVKANWQAVDTKINNDTLLNRFIESALSYLVQKADISDIENFFSSTGKKISDRTITIIKDKITGRAQYKDRSQQQLKDWLEKNNDV
ncbi:hypothetical protein MKX08_001133 [Trichoderma sp. CBMAI-0020]|nr:hypothetical protein MKX08_001133 [Trichoderma sp. CBMAI-0020]